MLRIGLSYRIFAMQANHLTMDVVALLRSPSSTFRRCICFGWGQINGAITTTTKARTDDRFWRVCICCNAIDCIVSRLITDDKWMNRRRRWPFADHSLTILWPELIASHRTVVVVCTRLPPFTRSLTKTDFVCERRLIHTTLSRNTIDYLALFYFTLSS